jgi:maltose-binding protein MalE
MENLSGRSFGAYEILEPLGEGGMAAVYRAYQPSVERYVAVKVLPRQFASDPTFVARFRREARVVAQLQHPHILPVFDFGESDGYTYFVMPLVSGGTLADRISPGIPPIDKTRIWISQVARALGYAHQRGLIHRDVKPSNVLLDDSDNCLLSDFGITHIAETSKALTTTGTVIGTPMYMAPEQGLGQTVDARTDIYALGIVLFQLVTGRVPYDADTPLATMLKHVNDPLPSARAINPACPESLERIILKALAKRREDRYQSANDMAHALDALDLALTQEPAPTPPIAVGAPTMILVESRPNNGPPLIAAPKISAASAEATAVADLDVGATRVMGAKVEPAAASVIGAAPARVGPARVWRRLALPAIVAGALILAGLGIVAFAGRPAASPAAPAPTDAPQNAAATPVTAERASSTAPAALLPPGNSREVVLWHALDEGGRDETALLAAIERLARESNGYTVTVVRVGADALYPSLASQGQAGHGPDLILDLDDNMIEHVAGGLFGAWDGYTDADGATLAPWARDAHILDGKRWALPVSAQLVAMFYNKARVTTPPATTAALMDATRSGTRLGVWQNCYSGYGFLHAFNGAILNPDGSTSVKREGVARAMSYLSKLKALAGSSAFSASPERFDRAFGAGDLDLYINGSWEIPYFREALGSKLGAAPLPSAQNAAAPFLDFRVLYLGAHSANPKAAVDLALTLSGAEYQRHFMDAAGWVPVRTSVVVTEPVMAGFQEAARLAQRRPQRPEFGAYWGQFCPAFDAIMDLGDDPATAVEAAFERIKAQNGR